ncbi:hypothetical protein SDC9_139274 [bioreactor metagenome]|uniref:Uncharacterized protein n=1 Tax=bioreactor metagenome TaxID=1076179 RepID=A0A645DS87_9ZZZZ
MDAVITAIALLKTRRFAKIAQQWLTAAEQIFFCVFHHCVQLALRHLTLQTLLLINKIAQLGDITVIEKQQAFGG